MNKAQTQEGLKSRCQNMDPIELIYFLFSFFHFNMFTSRQWFLTRNYIVTDVTFKFTIYLMLQLYFKA